ncbi:hypothetical protein C1X64_19800 [Pseudomonas sp. GW456-E7]|nr:hypothetical protein C1X64_19800 [Pseudomonas sp. GW456-E7]
MIDAASVKGIGTAIKTCVNLTKSVGPLFISQFDYAKFKYLDFKQKQAQVAGYAEFFFAETRALVELKSEQRRDSLSKTGLERIKAEENINLISKEINKLLVYSKVPTHIRYLELDQNQQEDVAVDEVININDTWIDRFNDLASKLNEEWRQNLLAKAFAIEADKPGTIDLDTLFTIGKLDQKSFYFFDAILSASLKMYEVYVLPLEHDTLDVEFDINGNKYNISNILYQLQHTGLLVYDDKMGVHLESQKLVQFRYQNDVLAAISPKNEFIPAIVTTRAGSALASMCTITSSETGRKVFDTFENKLLQLRALHKRYVY